MIRKAVQQLMLGTVTGTEEKAANTLNAIKNAGYKVICCPDATVYHVGGGTLPKSSPLKTLLNFRNNLAMLYKNLPQNRLRPVIGLRIVLDWVAALSFLVKGNGAEFLAVFKAHREFRSWKPALQQKRAAVAPHQTNCILPRWLLIQYHLLHHKHFSQLNIEKGEMNGWIDCIEAIDTIDLIDLIEGSAT